MTFSREQEVLGLGCGHRYCESCWRQYLTLKIADEGAAESIQCPTGKCGIIVDDDFIMKLVSDKHVREKYQRLITNSFVQVSDFAMYFVVRKHGVYAKIPLLCPA